MKFKLKGIFEKSKFTWFLSIAIAVISWFVVAVAIDPETTISIADIPININTQASAISRLELNAIDGSQAKVTLIIRGKSYVVGNMNSSDFAISASLTGVTGPGVFDLPLEVKKLSGEDVEILQVRPSTVRVKFDRLSSKTLPIEVDINGLVVEGEDYIVEKETVTPAEVNITGAEIDVNKIVRAVVKVGLSEPISKPMVVKEGLTFLDIDGNVVDTPYISQDTATAEVIIPVKKIAELPLTVSYTSLPPGFNPDELHYSLSNQTIRVAAVPEMLGNFTEIHLGYINLRDLNFFEPITFNVTLPAGFTNLDNVESVVVEYNDTGFSTAVFNVSTINLINQPPNYSVSITTPRITGVRVVGPKEVLDKLTTRDIVAEIDLSEREIAAGQYSLPVNLYVPGKGPVWVTGSYTAVVSVRQK